MYDISRGIYQSLRPYVAGAADDLPRRHRLLLRSCEAAVRLVAEDPAAPAHAARHLFRDVRTLLHPARQLDALTVIERRLTAVAETLAAGAQTAAMGLCAATNRKGKPCAREAMKGSRYCPSHRAREEAGVSPGLRPETA